MTSFEMGLSKTVPGETSVLILRPCPRVRGWMLHLLSGTIFVNDMAWAQDGQCLDRAQMDGCFGCHEIMNDLWAHSR